MKTHFHLETWNLVDMFTFIQGTKNSWLLYYNCFPPPKMAFSYFGILWSGGKKCCKKAHIRPMISIFWQKIPNSILLKVKKNEEDISNTFWVIKKNTERVVHYRYINDQNKHFYGSYVPLIHFLYGPYGLYWGSGAVALSKEYRVRPLKDFVSTNSMHSLYLSTQIKIIYQIK